MARSVATIQASILANFAANPNLTYVDNNGITRPLTNNTSMYAIFNAIAYCVALAQAVLEQLMDLYVVQIEGIVAQSAAASSQWIQAKMFAFQYSVDNPQIVKLINGIPQYPQSDPSLRIITACSVGVDLSNNVNVKCATSSPLKALDDDQKAAAQAYINLIGVDGVKYQLISFPPDRIQILASVYYNGMFGAVIKSTVINSINNYLQTLSITNFDGSLKMSDLENFIRNIPGVNDVVLENVYIRKDGLPFPIPGNPITPKGLGLIVDRTVVHRIYDSAGISNTAGYIISEDTTDCTLEKSLTFIPQ